MKRVIGIGGLKRSGKSTLADYIIRESAMRNWTTEEISFAEPIKLLLQEVFRYEVPYATFVDDKRKQNQVEVVPGVFMTVRELLQKVGTECFRNVIHPEFWIARGLARIKASSADIIVIPDIRFGNELDAIKSLNSTTIFIDRPGLERTVDLHPSEAELETIKHEFDSMLINEEDKKEVLKRFANDLVRGI